MNRIVVFQHAIAEGPGLIKPWLEEKGFAVEIVDWSAGESADAGNEPDGYLIMGGAMNIYQHRDYPWLVEEKQIIRRAVLERDVPVVGICLGAQLIADALGAKVVQSPQYELGWWPVNFTPEAKKRFAGIPASLPFFHWHGDTFTLPQDALRLASSAACPEQGFLWQERVLALQFHPEVDPAHVETFCTGDFPWPDGPWVQNRDEITERSPSHWQPAADSLVPFLEWIFVGDKKAVSV